MFTFIFLLLGMGVDDTDDMTQAVLTCQGDIDDPEFPKRRDSLFLKLQQVLENGKSYF